jgi:CheY-like chemotaxis protein/two-component sensor histidine kinase
MVGWMQLLRSGLLGPDETRSALDTVARNLTAQTRLVEEVLDVSRIITGKMALDTAPVALADVVRAALEVARPAAAAKGLRIETAVDPSVPPVEGDADRLRQVVWNLVGNAVKFTPSGGLVRVSLGAGPGRAVLTVADTGEGIPADFLPYVFDRFRQADAGKSRRHGGLGLGLSLVRHLVELHGGTAAAESAGPGKGATFTVVLPTAAATATAVMATSASASATASVDSPHLPPPPASAMALRRSAEAASVPSGPSGRPPPSPPPPARPVTDGADMSGVRVLVVEDTPDSREMLAAMLRMAGAEVHTAADADEAMAAMQDGVGVPDVLVSDIGLPGRDGFSLIAELRSRPGRAAGVPAVALTGYASGEDRRRCLKAGFQEHVAKPVEPRRLFDAVVAALNGRGRSRSQTKGDEG